MNPQLLGSMISYLGIIVENPGTKKEAEGTDKRWAGGRGDEKDS